MATPRKHHYVPQFYLSGFTAEPGSSRLFVLDKQTGKSYPSRIGDAGCERDFYIIEVEEEGDPFAVEKLFSAVEADGAEALRFIIDRRAVPEADAFAANLLLPSRLLRPLVNDGPLTLEIIDDLADRFQTSRMCTAVRCVELSDFPCALVAVRGGGVAWSIPSQRLIDERIYPPARTVSRSPHAAAQWSRFVNGERIDVQCSTTANHWFQLYDDETLQDVHVSERYFGIPSMSTLLALLTIPEDELCGAADEDEDGEHE